MSLITDALKKAELQRSAPTPLRADAWNHSPTSYPQEHSSSPRRSSRALVIANVALLGTACVAVVFFMSERSLQSNSAPEGAAAATFPSETPTPLDDLSESNTPASLEQVAPTQPFAHTSQPVTANTSDYELVGTSTLGDTTLLSILRRSDGRSVWVPVGRTVGEINAVSYDSATDRAVIRVNGNALSVGVREGPPRWEPGDQSAE